MLIMCVAYVVPVDGGLGLCTLAIRPPRPPPPLWGTVIWSALPPGLEERFEGGLRLCLSGLVHAVLVGQHLIYFSAAALRTAQYLRRISGTFQSARFGL